MALSPFESTEERIETVSEEQVTRTYKIDFKKGRVGGIIDGKEALKQAIYKAIITARFRFPIYDDQYSCELKDLIGEDISRELFETEVRRVIIDALIYIEEVVDVRDFDITREGNKVHITFTVDSIYGEIQQEVSI